MTLRNFLGAFHISLLQSARLHHLGGKALLTEPVPSYLVVVAASEEALYHYLKQRFAPDTSTHVILDRRRRSDATAPERRRALAAHNLSIRRVAVIRLTDEPRMGGAMVTETAGQGRTVMVGMEGLEDRQRVDRWLEESQYLIGRMIPAYLDDRDRVRGRLEASEHDNERLRGELTDARREIAELRAELEFLRAERNSVSDSFSTIVEHLTALQKPINEVSRHLNTGQPSEVHA
jgi:hypothetical protein